MSSGVGPEQDDTLTLQDHRQEQEGQKRRQRNLEFIQRAIDQSYHYLEGAHIARVGPLLEGLAERLGVRRWELGQLSDRVHDSHGFYLREVEAFMVALHRGLDATQAIASVVRHGRTAQSPVEVCRRILESLVSIAAMKGVLPSELQDVQPVQGYSMQLGERYVRADSKATGTLNLRDSDDELKSILCAGGKGSGKSTAVETLLHDSSQNGHKVVDLVDFFKAENATLDLEQQDNGEGLIEAREEMGLPTGFHDIQAGFGWLFEEQSEDCLSSPDIEILVPLCPGLEEMSIPAVAGEEPVVKPFTIPASELTYRQLVMLLHHTTDARESEIRSAHQSLRDSGDDWSLSDLADEIRLSTNAGESLAEKIETSLKTAQDKSFIRDSECPHKLNWDEVMQDEETITAFTVFPVGETSDYLVVLSYLIDSLFEARRGLIQTGSLHEYPPLTIAMREMHKVAPRSTAESSAEATVENYMVDSLEDVFALTRHANMEVIADTQKFYRQLNPDVAELFDHILAFRGHIPDVKRIFKTRVDNTGPAETVAQYQDPGMCAFVSERGYRLPIRFAPPPSHHLEAKDEGDGLSFRTRVDESDEELIDAPWNADLPARLSFGSEPTDPLAIFLKDYVSLVPDMSGYEFTETIHEAYLEWAEENGEPRYQQKEVTKRLKNLYEQCNDDTYCRPLHPEHDKQRPAFKGIRLEWDG